MENQRKLSDFQKQFIASAIGSAISSVVLSPVIVVKVRLQNSLYGVEVTLLDTIKSIYRSDGLRGFWNGGKTALVQSIPSNVIYMTTYEHLKKELNNNNSIENKQLLPAGAGAFARTVSVTAVSPLELIRTIQASGIQKSIKGIVRDITQQTGIIGLYKGLAPTLLRDVPFSSLYWFTFEFMKPFYRQVFSDVGLNHMSNITTFLSGSTAGFVSALITHPFDVLKTQKQLEQVLVGEPSPISSTTTTTTTSVKTRMSMFFQHKNENQCCINSSRSRTCTKGNSLHILVNLYRDYGFSHGLYRGLSLRLMMVIPGGAVMITIYEAIKRMLEHV